MKKSNLETNGSKKTLNECSGREFICSKKLICGENDLVTVCPDVASYFNSEKNFPLTPDKILANSKDEIWWICPSGHEFVETPYIMVVLGKNAFMIVEHFGKGLMTLVLNFQSCQQNLILRKTALVRRYFI